MSDLTTATEIRNQIGAQALMMIGAKNIAGDEKSLQFKIGRNSKGITHIVIELNGMDLYKMTFLNCRNYQRVVKAEHDMIYADMLHAMIEKETGLNTRL